jgi:restriction endonuclease
MIFSGEPTDWFDLQNKVAQIFNEIGCIVEEEKEIVTTRGSVNVDVYVQDITKLPNLTYICECKHWESSIPKSIVHSFRTVIADYGAHVGYMISKKGYQSGAYEAAAWTNIMLLTWNDARFAHF